MSVTNIPVNTEWVDRIGYNEKGNPISFITHAHTVLISSEGRSVPLDEFLLNFSGGSKGSGSSDTIKEFEETYLVFPEECRSEAAFLNYISTHNIKWETSSPAATKDNPNLWKKIVIVYIKNNIEVRSDPYYNFCGSLGLNGIDGTDVEFIFKLVDSSENAPTLNEVNADIDLPKYQEDDYRPYGWSDDPKTLKEETPYQYVSKRKKKDGVWKEFSTPSLWGYLPKDSNLKLTTNSIFYGGTSDTTLILAKTELNLLNISLIKYQEGIISFNQTTNWKDNAADSWEVTYMAICYFDESGNCISISNPFKVSGATIGSDSEKDGVFVEFAYCLPPKGTTTLDVTCLPIDSKLEDSVTCGDVIWYNHASDCSPTDVRPIQYATMRTGTYADTVNESGETVRVYDGAWEVPFAWSLWGAEGIDGDGVQFVFFRMPVEMVAGIATSFAFADSDSFISKLMSNPELFTWNYELVSPESEELTSESYPKYTTLKYNEITYNFGDGILTTDDPCGTSILYPIELCSKRTYTWEDSEKTTKGWSTFSRPSIWTRDIKDPAEQNAYTINLVNDSTCFTRNSLGSVILGNDNSTEVQVVVGGTLVSGATIRVNGSSENSGTFTSGNATVSWSRDASIITINSITCEGDLPLTIPVTIDADYDGTFIAPKIFKLNGVVDINNDGVWGYKIIPNNPFSVLNEAENNKLTVTVESYALVPTSLEKNISYKIQWQYKNNENVYVTDYTGENEEICPMTSVQAGRGVVLKLYATDPDYANFGELAENPGYYYTGEYEEIAYTAPAGDGLAIQDYINSIINYEDSLILNGGSAQVSFRDGNGNPVQMQVDTAIDANDWFTVNGNPNMDTWTFTLKDSEVGPKSKVFQFSDIDTGDKVCIVNLVLFGDVNGDNIYNVYNIVPSTQTTNSQEISNFKITFYKTIYTNNKPADTEILTDGYVKISYPTNSGTNSSDFKINALGEVDPDLSGINLLDVGKIKIELFVNDEDLSNRQEFLSETYNVNNYYLAPVVEYIDILPSTLGNDATLKYISLNADYIAETSKRVFSPATLTASAKSVTGKNEPEEITGVTWKIKVDSGSEITLSKASINLNTDTLNSQSVKDVLTNASEITILCYKGTTLIDSETLPILREGTLSVNITNDNVSYAKTEGEVFNTSNSAFLAATLFTVQAWLGFTPISLVSGGPNQNIELHDSGCTTLGVGSSGNNINVSGAYNVTGANASRSVTVTANGISCTKTQTISIVTNGAKGDRGYIGQTVRIRDWDKLKGGDYCWKQTSTPLTGTYSNSDIDSSSNLPKYFDVVKTATLNISTNKIVSKYYRCIADYTVPSSSKPTTPPTSNFEESDAYGFLSAELGLFETMVADSAQVKKLLITDNDSAEALVVAGMINGYDSEANNTDVRIFAGTSDTVSVNNAPFRVENSGKMIASDAEISGTIKADSFLVNAGNDLASANLNDTNGVMWITTWGLAKTKGTNSNLDLTDDTPVIVIRKGDDFFVLNPLALGNTDGYYYRVSAIGVETYDFYKFVNSTVSSDKFTTRYRLKTGSGGVFANIDKYYAGEYVSTENSLYYSQEEAYKPNWDKCSNYPYVYYRLEGTTVNNKKYEIVDLVRNIENESFKAPPTLQYIELADQCDDTGNYSNLSGTLELYALKADNTLTIRYTENDTSFITATLELYNVGKVVNGQLTKSNNYLGKDREVTPFKTNSNGDSNTSYYIFGKNTQTFDNALTAYNTFKENNSDTNKNALGYALAKAICIISIPTETTSNLLLSSTDILNYRTMFEAYTRGWA